jgi:amino acid adenylation domain-containing protein
MGIELVQAAGEEFRSRTDYDAKRRPLRLPMREPEQEPGRIRPRPAGSKVPLSAEQRRVWLHASQQPDLPIYNEPFTIHRRGSFDLPILEASLNEILRRHEVWRTSFSPEGEQLVHSQLQVALSLVDLSDLPPAEREAEALRLATEDAREPISINTVPLFRMRAVRMRVDEHRLYCTFHHIIFDGVSISDIFMPELSAIYAAFERGKPSPFAVPALQYGDYAIGRERRMASSKFQRHIAYWRKHLSGELPILHLPEDHSRPSVASHRGSMECFEIPGELLENLRRLSGARGATPYITLLAAFAVLLFRYSGQNDLIIGSVASARRRSELESVIGYFLDTYAIRAKPVAKLRFSEFLVQVREAVLDGLDAAEVPFERVVHEVNPKRDAGQHPLFQAFFSMRPPTPSFSEGWNLTQMDVTVDTSKFVLHLELGERSHHIEGRFLYHTDIWDRSTIKRMAEHWLVLLRSICHNPDSTLGSLPILTPGETSAVLGVGGWNDTSSSFPQEPLDALIERQVRRTPEAIAASFGGERWSYQELNCRADTLAGLLRAAGAGRGSIVAIMLDRSLDMLAGLIAVLKTGAAYLPIDLRMPRERIALCLRDAEASAILTHSSLVPLIPSGATGAVFVDGDCKLSRLPAIGACTLPPSRGARNLEDTAYVIYTSGTTGAPKGVEISQRSLVNLLASMRMAPGFTAEDILLAVTPISFDIAALEMFLPLMCGGSVVIASREEVQDPHLLAGALRRSECTVMQATPATWRSLLLSGWNDARSTCRHGMSRVLRILCGGEALPRELAGRLLATGAELWNMYGPTETTIWSLIHRVDGTIDNQTGPISVGKPIGNTTAYILDAQRELLPPGVAGELFLGGVGLAKGYRGQPSQTAERFVTVESVQGERLFRTGDLAVQRPDGNVEVLGRTDNQVKIRGHRVELEAVEAAVLQHPKVAGAAARAWPESVGEFRLSVYLTSRTVPPPSAAEMRTFLGAILPEYMIPSDFIVVAAIPLTAHGKVDRSRLPALANIENEPAHETICSAEVLRLSAIWRDLLGKKHIGVDDNFFDLGGHSLLIVALQQRIAEEFSQQIPIAELFHSPTVRQQAELAQRSEEKPVLPAGVMALRPGRNGRGIFWVHYLRVDLAKELGDTQPFYSVVLTREDCASLGETPTPQSVATCLMHKILATQTKGPYSLGGFCLGGILAYEIACQMRTAGHEVSLVVLLDAPNPAYLQKCDSLARKFSYLGYLLKKAQRLGVHGSFVYLFEHLRKRWAKRFGLRPARTEMRVAQEMCEVAMANHQPGQYDGAVLLLLAAERPPHKNYLAGWQEVVTGDLRIQYLNAHHDNLLKSKNLRSVAEAITSHLGSILRGEGCAYRGRTPEKWAAGL